MSSNTSHPLPPDALWGAQTQQAVENFPISQLEDPREFIQALAYIKSAAAQANQDLQLLDKKKHKPLLMLAIRLSSVFMIINFRLIFFKPDRALAVI